MSLRAFSLIEVMAAVAIFGVGLAAVFSCMNVVSQQFEHQRHTTFALHLAEARMEELLLRLANDAELVAGSDQGPVWFDQRGFVTPAGCPSSTTGTPPETTACRYRVTWRTAAAGIARMRSLAVTVAWNERGSLRSVGLTTQRN